MEYGKLTVSALRLLCKERAIRGVSKTRKADIVALLESTHLEPSSAEPAPAGETVASVDETVAPENEVIAPLRQEVVQGDTLQVLPTLDDDSAQIILADPPYNIGKDFGNDSDKQEMDTYLQWCDRWIAECLRVLKPNGTMFIYGFSETLAYISTRVPMNVPRRWLIWHYTNKNVPSLNFWQRSHESILVLWKSGKVFHRDDVREPYTDTFLKGAAGKERKATKGRFSKGDKSTVYTAHADGALPRDVIKVPALAGGAGKKERVDHPTQKPLALCDKLLRSCQQPATDGYVLIPFAGSGSECVAAKKLDLPFIGIELNADYVALTNKRLQD